jgi:hypothetical protein
MTQDQLPFQYAPEETAADLTGFSGLPLYSELMRSTGLWNAIEQQMCCKQQGWQDVQIIESLILLNIAGGDCVEDMNRLEEDRGLRKIILKSLTHGMRKKEKQWLKRRWRQASQRAFPSTSAIHRYLKLFHEASTEAHREVGKAYIPPSNTALQRLCELNSLLLNFAQKQRPCKTATLDQDATLCESHKRYAQYCYKKYPAYQPFNTYWHEQKLLVHSEFRDGNVPASYNQLRLFKTALACLPEGVEHAYLRSDAAGYQAELLRYCAEGKNKRFGVIEFAVSAYVSSAFKQAVLELKESAWKTLIYTDDMGQVIETTQEWAEVGFVPNWVAHSKKIPDLRYIALREKMTVQRTLPGVEVPVQAFPFPTLDFPGKHLYKVFAIVTNRTIPGDELIHWHRERCGESEQVHSAQKNDLAGGQFPSSKFGANAAWWQIMILAYNLNSLMKTFVLPKSLQHKRLKGLRLHFICLPGRLMYHARQLLLKLNHAAVTLLQDMRERILALSQAPPASISITT